MSEIPPQSSGLGSLAQSARGKQLKTARGIMLFVGILTILFNGFLFFNAENEVKKVTQDEARKAGGAVHPAQVRDFEATVLRFCRLIYGGSILLGVVFVVLGIIVKKYPVPATAIALILYVGSMVIFAVLVPGSIASGIIVKIIIIVALIKSLTAAIAYQKEQQMSAEELPA